MIIKAKVQAKPLQKLHIHLLIKRNWHSCNHVQLFEMDSPLHNLTTLAGDCLYEIFTPNYIDTDDLLEIAVTCKRLQPIAKQAYRTKFNQVENFDRIKGWSLEQLEKYLRQFGEYRETFNSNWINRDVNTVLRLLAKYCKNLAVLKCAAWKGDIVLSDLKRMPPTHVPDNWKLKFDGIFDENLPLHTFKLNKCIAALPAQHFPRLHTVQLTEVLPELDTLTSFLKQNSQLIRLELDYILHDFGIDRAIEDLVNLEIFSYSAFNLNRFFTYDCFTKFTKLRKFRLTMNTPSAFKILSALLTANAPLKTLITERFSGHQELAAVISQFGCVEELTLGYVHHFEGVMQIAENMPQLKHLNCQIISEHVTATNVWQVLQKAKQLHSASFKFMCGFDFELHFADFQAISLIAADRSMLVKILIQSNILVRNGFDIFRVNSKYLL